MEPMKQSKITPLGSLSDSELFKIEVPSEKQATEQEQEKPLSFVAEVFKTYSSYIRALKAYKALQLQENPYICKRVKLNMVRSGVGSPVNTDMSDKSLNQNVQQLESQLQICVRKNPNRQQQQKWLPRLANQLMFKLSDSKTQGFIIFTEFFRGQSMMDILANNGHLPIQVFKTYFLNLVKVVYFFYRHGVIYDRKSLLNIVGTEKGEIKLLDLATVKFINQHPTVVDIPTEVLDHGDSTRYERDLEKHIVFNLGYLMYFLYVSAPPFDNYQDKLYNRIVSGNSNKFWQFCEANYDKVIDQRFRVLFLEMIHPKPQNRPGIVQVLKNEWLNLKEEHLSEQHLAQIFLEWENTIREEKQNEQATK